MPDPVVLPGPVVLPDPVEPPDLEEPPAMAAVPAPIPLIEDGDSAAFIPEARPVDPWLTGGDTDPGADLNLARAIFSIEFRISIFSSATDISYLTLKSSYQVLCTS